jgi:glutamate--cysteine ligase
VLTKDDLIAVLSSGCKPPSQWRMGLEHEQFAYNKKTGSPLPYDGQPGIKQILEFLSQERGWSGKKREGEHVIALTKGVQSITLEPAGQIELSGAPHAAIAEMVAEHQAYLEDLRHAGEALGVGFLSAGVHPHWKREDMQWMPKARYKIMRAYMPKRGNLGLDMMSRTSGAQINLDYESERDMVRKYRVTVALQPVMIALFANSRILEGKDSGYASYRAHIWEDTDPDRTGILPFIFEEGMGFERYVDYVLDVPMYFIERNGELIDMSGKSFRDFMAGTLPENKTYEATLKDWEDHLTTAFPEVRLKKYLELRGTDSVTPPLLYALAAFWVGILYSAESLEQAAALIKDWTVHDHAAFRRDVSIKGLDTSVPRTGQTIRDFAPSLIALAEKGLEGQPSQREGIAYLTSLSPEEWKRDRYSLSPGGK